jgi:hypothetical protein
MKIKVKKSFLLVSAVFVINIPYFMHDFFLKTGNAGRYVESHSYS